MLGKILELTYVMVMIERHEETHEDKEYKYQQHGSHSWTSVIKILLKVKSEAVTLPCGKEITKESCLPLR